jgi:hypothetical protein
MALKITVGRLFPFGVEGPGKDVQQFKATVEDDEHPDVIADYTYLRKSTGEVFPASLRLRPAQWSTNFSELTRMAAGNIRDLPLARWERAATAHVMARLSAQGEDIPEGNVRHGSGRVSGGIAGYGIGQARETDEAMPIRTTKTYRLGTAVDKSSPQPVGAKASVPQPTVRIDAVARPATVGAKASVPQPTVTTTPEVSLPPTAADYGRLGAAGVIDVLHPGLRDATTKGGQRRYRALLRMADAAARYLHQQMIGAHDPVVAVAKELDSSVPATRSLLQRARRAELLPKPLTAQQKTSDVQRLTALGVIEHEEVPISAAAHAARIEALYRERVRVAEASKRAAEAAKLWAQEAAQQRAMAEEAYQVARREAEKASEEFQQMMKAIRAAGGLSEAAAELDRPDA